MHDNIDYYVHDLKTSWPNAVGDCVERASAIIRWCSPYYVEVHPYKVSRKTYRNFGYDDRRVILFVDAQGYVATTPRVG